MVAAGVTSLKHCTVRLSDATARGKRIDASAFDVDAMQMRSIVDGCRFGTVKLGSLLDDTYYGPRLKRRYVSRMHKGIVGLAGSSEMLDCYPKPVKFMVQDDDNVALRVKKDTVLVSRSGTIGNVVLVNDTLSRYFVSEDAIRLECTELPGYVYAYLRTAVGKSLVKSNTFGAVIQHVEPDHMREVLVPNAPRDVRERVNDLVMESYRLRDESNAMVDEATAMLVEALALPPVHELDRDLIKQDAGVDTFSVKLSDMAGRADASYHVPIVDAIVDHLKAHAGRVTTVGGPRISKEVILPGRFKRVYVDEGHGVTFIGGKQLWELDPSNKKYLSNVKHGDRISEQLRLHEGMTLITRSGSIGKVMLVPRHWEDWVASEHIIRVVPADDEIAGYLNVFLASDYGRELICRYTYGSVVDEITDEHVRSIPVPLLGDEQVQATINGIMLEANRKRFEAYELEQEAIRIVNEDVLGL